MSIFSINKKVKYNINDIKTNKIVLHHHLGLGDHLTCNGLVNYTSQYFDKIYLPVFEKNFNTINYLYKVNKKVKLFLVNQNNEFEEINDYSKKNKIDILRIGFENLKTPIQESFYSQIGLPYSHSIKYFNYQYDNIRNELLESYLIKKYKAKNEYKVAHIEGSQGTFKVENLNNINSRNLLLIEKKTDKYKNIFNYIKILNNAKEIHCINSSIFCLAERIPTNGKLFFHNLKKEPDVKNVTSFYKDWNFIDY